MTTEIPTTLHSSDRERRKSGIRGTTSFRFVQVARFHRRRAADLLGELDLHPGQEMILENLWTRGTMNQSDLSDHVGVRRATLSVALRPLEKAGLIERICDPDDRRVMQVTATEKSQELRLKVYEIWGQINREMISGLEPDEVRTFDRLLRKVRRNLSDKVLNG